MRAWLTGLDVADLFKVFEPRDKKRLAENGENKDDEWARAAVRTQMRYTGEV